MTRNLHFADEEDSRNFTNQVVNPKTLSEWIKCAFNGNVLELTSSADKNFKARADTMLYIDSLFNNR
jgi:hypothetical protein